MSSQKPISDRARVTIEKIRKYVTVGTDKRPEFFFSMTKVNKIGITPQSGYVSTPFGIYFYLLNEETLKMIEDGSLPYAGESTYIQVCGLLGNFLFLGDMTKEKYDELFGICKEWLDKNDLIRFENPKSQGPKGYAVHFMDMARYASEKKYPGKELNKAYSVFLRDVLGLDGIIDPGFGAIHINEPQQAVALRTSSVAQVETFLNPHASERIYGLHDPSDESYLRSKDKAREASRAAKEPKQSRKEDGFYYPSVIEKNSLTWNVDGKFSAKRDEGSFKFDGKGKATLYGCGRLEYVSKNGLYGATGQIDIQSKTVGFTITSDSKNFLKGNNVSIYIGSLPCIKQKDGSLLEVPISVKKVNGVWSVDEINFMPESEFFKKMKIRKLQKGRNYDFSALPKFPNGETMETQVGLPVVFK